ALRGVDRDLQPLRRSLGRDCPRKGTVPEAVLRLASVLGTDPFGDCPWASATRGQLVQRRARAVSAADGNSRAAPESREPNHAIATSHGSVPITGSQLPRIALPPTTDTSKSNSAESLGLRNRSMDSVCRFCSLPEEAYPPRYIHGSSCAADSAWCLSHAVRNSRVRCSSPETSERASSSSAERVSTRRISVAISPSSVVGSAFSFASRSSAARS